MKNSKSLREKINNMSDILSIDLKIKRQFATSKDELSKLQKNLIKITDLLSNNDINTKNRKDLEDKKKELEKNIFDIENDIQEIIYTTQTEKLLEKYKIILRTPIKTSITGNYTSIKKTNEKNIISKKIEIIQAYMEIARKYIELPITNSKKTNSERVCSGCGNEKEFFNLNNDTYVCAICFIQNQTISNVSFRDSDRVPFSHPYQYHRGIHFAECMRQYQAKQNTTIEQRVYEKLEGKIEENYLLCPKFKTRKERYRRVNKQHILNFLKELDLSNHNENVHLIHFKITDIPPDDISHLEDVLTEDFKQLTEIYDRESLKPECNMVYKRKNFIMTQFVLYRLLLRHNHPCSKDNFYNLSPNIEDENDDICRYLFEILSWNYNSY